MKELGYSISEEEKFVKSLFTNFWKKFDQKIQPRKDEEGRVKAKSLVAFGQVIVLLILTSTAGLGYVFKALGSYFKHG